MYSRIVSMRVKPDRRSEFSRVIENDVLPILRKQKGFQDEVTFLATNGTDAIGISLWDNKESAEAYHRVAYPDVMKALEKVLEGTPQVQTYDVANSTVHRIAARAA